MQSLHMAKILDWHILRLTKFYLCYQLKCRLPLKERKLLIVVTFFVHYCFPSLFFSSLHQQLIIIRERMVSLMIKKHGIV
jgi:hypothetical protein